MNENAYTSMEKSIGEVKVSQKSKPYTKTDSFFAFVYIILGFTFIRFFFFYDWLTNFTTAIRLYTLVYITTVIFYTKAKGRHLPKESFFWAAVMLCIAFLFKINEFFILLVQIFTAAYFTAVTGDLYGGGTSAYLPADLWSVFLGRPLGNFLAIFPAAFTIFRKKEKREKLSVHPAVWGGVMSVGALWVILPLLIKADSNFLSGTTDFVFHLFAAFSAEDFSLFLMNCVLAIPVSCYLYGLGYGSMTGSTDAAREELDTARSRMRISPAVTLKVLLYTVSAVYIMFVALQAEYLLGAFSGTLYSGYTYAEYARTGFFELCKVAAVNLSLLALCNLLITQQEKERMKTSAALLCILSLVLLSTAMAKMVMYITVYGLTVKRIISTVFLLWLAVVFVMCIARLGKSFNITKAAVITGAVMFCIMFSFDIEAHSHNYNLKYGFVKILQLEYAHQTNSLYLPEYIKMVRVADSTGEISADADAPAELVDLIRTAADTAGVSVQDTPYADFYYIISLYGEEGDSALLYVYEKEGRCFIEQPYNAICTVTPHIIDILTAYCR